MRPTLLVLTLGIGLVPVTLRAQKSAAIGEPLIWSKVAYDRDAHVFFDKDKNPTKEYWKIPSGASNKKEEWRVFTDRDQVRVLSEPEEAASEVKNPTSPTASAPLPRPWPNRRTGPAACFKRCGARTTFNADGGARSH